MLVLHNIVEIDRAEKEAAAILESAEATSRNTIKDAKSKVEENMKLANEEAKKDFETIVNNCVSSADGEVEEILKNGENEVKNISNPSNEKISKAVDLVIERIVKGHGNN